MFRGLGTRDVGSRGIPCHHRSFERGRAVVRFSSSFGVISNSVVKQRSDTGSVTRLRDSVSSVGMLKSDVKERCCGRITRKGFHTSCKLAGRSATGVRGTSVRRCGISDLCRISPLVRGRGIVSSTIDHTRGVTDSLAFGDCAVRAGSCTVQGRGAR